MTTAENNPCINTHWNRPHLREALLEAVTTLGIDLSTATPEVLAPLDQFHGGGKEATRALASQAGLSAGMHILDVGGGLGGPARMLAVEYGVRVTVCDPTADYLQAGDMLTARMGLADQVDFHYGHALDLPFPDGSFDLVWTQNSGMNIADKARLYRGFFSVLKPTGRLAQLEPVAGPVQPPYFPLMWASTPADNHLLTAEALRQVIRDSGFLERHWNPAVRFTPSAASTPPPTLTIQGLVMGDRLPAIQEARRRNEEEDRLQSVLAVFDRP